jgi:hypothetical protein
VKNIDLKKILVWLAIAFIIVSIWVDPRGSSQSIGAFLGDVGHFLSELIFKTATFISGLGR